MKREKGLPILGKPNKVMCKQYEMGEMKNLRKYANQIHEALNTCMQKIYHREEKDKKRQGFSLKTSKLYIQMKKRSRIIKKSILIKGNQNLKRVT